MKNKLDFAALIVSIIALLISAYTYNQTDNTQKKTAAYSLWQDYLQFAVSQPELAQGIRPKNDSITHQYEWFVANTLGAAEIVYDFQDDPLWRYTIKEVMKNHVNYLKSEKFQQQRGDYDPKLIEIIDEAIIESEKKN